MQNNWSMEMCIKISKNRSTQAPRIQKSEGAPKIAMRQISTQVGAYCTINLRIVPTSAGMISPARTGMISPAHACMISSAPAGMINSEPAGMIS